MAHRFSLVRSRLSELKADAILLSAMPDVYWTCGFTGSNGILIVGEEKAHFVTDGRYSAQAQEEVEGATVHVTREGLSTSIQENGLLAPYAQVAFQADDMTVAQREALEEQNEEVEWIPKKEILTRLVARKDTQQVDRIREAQAITESVFEAVPSFVEAGKTERDVAAEITYRHLKKGADRMAFPPIVASGPNAARPHARPTDRTLQSGDLVVIDMGCFRNGYASDMTRTVAMGAPSSVARRGYEVVRQAQEEALMAARSGMMAKELDSVARAVIEEAGLGDHFSHGLGHGIGVRVHEWPRVSHRVEENLPERACVTIEPGVYVPDKEYGVRIEDIVLLHPDGCENLTGAPKELLTL